MIIQIELIVISLLALILLVWAVWFRWSTRRLKKKYNKRNPDNDKYKTREGGEERGSSEVGRRKQDIEDTDSSVPRPIQSPKRELLPPTPVVVSRQNRPRFRNALRRIRRAKRTS